MSIRKDRFAVEADEIAFFADYYEHERYNPVGWSLRLERELASVLRACRGQRLDDVLSLGCGDGQFELMLAPYAGRITALDISPQAIKVARHKAADAGITNVEFLCLPLHALAWDRSFDCMICLAFLHHLREADLTEFLRTARDHLKPGGLFYSQDPNRRGILRWVGRRMLGSTYHKFHSPDEIELDPNELADRVRKVGYQDVLVDYIDFTLIPALFLLAKRPGAILRVCCWVDWLWCHSPFARWASGFKLTARKPLAPSPGEELASRQEMVRPVSHESRI